MIGNEKISPYELLRMLKLQCIDENEDVLISLNELKKAISILLAKEMAKERGQSNE